MKVAFIGIKEPHQGFGHVGLEIMAELLKRQGHSVIGVSESTFDASDYVTEDEFRKLRILRKFKPDYVCFTVLSHRYQWCLKFARLVKGDFHGVKVVFGGAHVSAVPETVIREGCVDVVCVGEGEEALVELVGSCRTDIQNLWFKDKHGRGIRNGLRPLVKDLDGLPFPNRELWVDVPKSEFQFYLLMVSRGCPYSCSYCQNSTYHELYKGECLTRFRSVENVVSELEVAKKRFGLKWVLPLDDNLLLNPKWFRDFAREYKKHIGVPYCATTHPLTLDFERAKLLKDSGCRFVKIGIQSGCERVRKTLMDRHESNRALLDAAYACRKAGLRFTLDHIFGVDDGSEALKASVGLYNCARPAQVNSFQLYVFPNTKIVKYLGLSAEDVGKVNCGVYQHGSIKGHHGLPYRNFLTLLPLMPQRMVSMVFKRPVWLKFFTCVPEPVLTVAKVVSNIRLRNTPALVANIKVIPHKIRERLRGYKGDFD